MAHTDDPHLKVVNSELNGNPESPNNPAVEVDDEARQRSLQLGGGVPGARIFGRYSTFLYEVRLELAKVTWPTRKQVVTETIVVLCVVAFFTLLITGVDNVLATFFNWLLFGKQMPWQS